MNRRQPLSAAACAVLIVPIMFDLASIAGSRIDTATYTCAAQWTTTSPPHLWSSGASDASATSQCSNCAEDGILARDPDARLSTMRTSWPNPSRRSATWEPMKPAPPVTTILGCSPDDNLHSIRSGYSRGRGLSLRMPNWFILTSTGALCRTDGIPGPRQGPLCENSAVTGSCLISRSGPEQRSQAGLAKRATSLRRHAAPMLKARPTMLHGRMSMTQDELTMDPLFSIITPTFNCGPDAIDQTMRSVLSQDFDSLEFLIIDADSNDGTRC